MKLEEIGLFAMIDEAIREPEKHSEMITRLAYKICRLGIIKKEEQNNK